jgi:ATP-dependent DNA ligase
MLAAPVDELRLPPGWAAEPKWDGFRAFFARPREGATILRSRRGTDMRGWFPELTTAAADLPPDSLLDGEVVVWHRDRLSFERLQERLNRTPATSAALAARDPAHFVAFDLLHFGDSNLAQQPYRERRAALERLFADEHLHAPWSLTPSTTDQRVAQSWLDWAAVGVEGVVLKDTRQRYLPGRRSWLKYRVRNVYDALIGAITGPLSRPNTALLGRYDGWAACDTWDAARPSRQPWPAPSARE